MSKSGRVPMEDVLRLSKSNFHKNKKKEANKRKARSKIDRRDW